jgi:hypothetical protein
LSNDKQEFKKVTIQPLAGVDFRIVPHVVPHGVAVTIRYFVQGAGDSVMNESFTAQSLTVGLTAAQATDVASSLQRAAHMIQSRAAPNK